MLTLKLAWRNLFRNTRRTLLTALLIGLSLAAMMITDGVILGMSAVLTTSMTDTLNGEAQIQRRGFSESLDVDLVLSDSAAIEAALTQDPAIAAFAPRAMTGGMISSTYNVSSGLIFGVDAIRERKVSKIEAALVEGDYLSGNPGEILIGKSLADLLEIGLGDRVVLTMSESGTAELVQALFRVTGVFEFGLRELDESSVFVNLPKARELLGLGTGSHQIILRFRDPAQATNPSLAVYRNYNTAEIEAINWMEANPSISSMLEMTGFSSFLVGAILFLLASLGVINSMFMSIYERIYEIGVIKAIGTRPGEILRLVLVEAGLIAVMSCLLGILVGGFGNWWFSIHGIPLGEMEISGISFANSIRAELRWSQFIDFPLYVVLLTLVAALYPARFASRIVPSDALHRSL